AARPARLRITTRSLHDALPICGFLYNAGITRSDRRGPSPMSWRLIFAFLLLAAGASAWGGLQLGDWLIAHGPAQIQMPKPHPELDAQAGMLDANGKPYVASAPQVRRDGRQGVPELQPPVDWKIQQDSLLDDGRPIALATTTISMDEAIALASRNQLGDGLQGIAQFGGLGGSQVV